MGQSGSGLRSVLVDPLSALYQGLTLSALDWTLGPEMNQLRAMKKVVGSMGDVGYR